MLKLLFSIWLGKAIYLLTRLLNIGGGSAAPGLYALKFDPDLISKLSPQIPTNIVITGTNGKTTTSRILAHFLKKQGFSILRNHTGSNLERGVVSALLSATNLLSGRIKDIDLAIWEIDEAAFNAVAPKLKPQIAVFLNVSRDQLDRYGEVDTIVSRWIETLGNLPKNCRVFINGDDVSLIPLIKNSIGEVRTFGVIKGVVRRKKGQKNNTKLDIFADNTQTNGLEGSRFSLNIDGRKIQTSIPVPGLYHIYDTVAALTVAYDLNLDLKKAATSLEDFKPAFGRVERFDKGYIFLVKNPAGTTQVIETITPQLKTSDRLLIALNDNFADGQDVSWIWDAEFEKLGAFNLNLTVYTSGTRANDLALRLKYAGLDPKNIVVEPSLERAFEEAKRGLEGKLYVLPTYTALLDLQKLLARQGYKKHYWYEI